VPRRLISSVTLLLFLVLLLAALWAGFDWPPAPLILRYGFPPTGGPTGRTMTIEGVEFVELKPGYFRMGSHFLCSKGNLLGRISAVLGLTLGEHPTHYSRECPPHWVEIDGAFWIGRTEVTNLQYERFEPQHEREWPGDEEPVTSVTIDDAEAYCKWLAGRSELLVSLPSEAQWEAACRAGTATEYSQVDDEAGLAEYAWLHENTEWGPHRVRTRRPNAWGLFDLLGNVSEWCVDVGHESYEGAPTDGTAWMNGGWAPLGGPPYRITRGGDWRTPAATCRCADRCQRPADDRRMDVGFRVVIGIPRTSGHE
jgi:formylglycine-generating enzyme required for sulfatase activity